MKFLKIMQKPIHYKEVPKMLKMVFLKKYLLLVKFFFKLLVSFKDKISPGGIQQKACVHCGKISK
jgi:hypothetical protein